MEGSIYTGEVGWRQSLKIHYPTQLRAARGLFAVLAALLSARGPLGRSWHFEGWLDHLCLQYSPTVYNFRTHSGAVARQKNVHLPAWQVEARFLPLVCFQTDASKTAVYFPSQVRKHLPMSWMTWAEYSADIALSASDSRQQSMNFDV